MNTHSNVGIFWDFENCRPQSISSGYAVANNIRQIAHEYGSVKLFKAYVEADSSLKPQLRSELQLAGVSLTDCPHNGKKEVADKMIIVDALLWALDNPPPSTIVIITNDRDFGYAISMLRLRQYGVVVISQAQPAPHVCLTTQASSFHSWEKDILQSTPTRIRARSLSTETPGPSTASTIQQQVVSRDRSTSFSTTSSFVTNVSDIQAPAPTDTKASAFSTIFAKGFGSPFKREDQPRTSIDSVPTNNSWGKSVDAPQHTALSSSVQAVRAHVLQSSLIKQQQWPNPLGASPSSDDGANDLWSPLTTPPSTSMLELVVEEPDNLAQDPSKNSAVCQKFGSKAWLRSQPAMPAHFRGLVALLRTFRAGGMKSVLMSKIASQLPDRARAMEAAGVSKFGQFCTLASDAGIIDIGNDCSPGTEWVRLRFSYVHDHEGALALVKATHPRFEMLVRTLSSFHIQGVEDAYQTAVAQKLIDQQLDLAPLGAPNFAVYVADAQALGIVKLGKIGNKDTISLIPAYGS